MVHDAGTGLPHLSFVDPAWRTTVRSALASTTPVSLGVVHPCGLRWFNDNVGHDMGDEIIRTVADAVDRLIDPDLLSYGNGEFLFLSRAEPARLDGSLAALDGHYVVRQRPLRLRVIHGSCAVASATADAVGHAWQQAGMARWVEGRAYRCSEQRRQLESAWASAFSDDQ